MGDGRLVGHVLGAALDLQSSSAIARVHGAVPPRPEQGQVARAGSHWHLPHLHKVVMCTSSSKLLAELTTLEGEGRLSQLPTGLDLGRVSCQSPLLGSSST